MECRRCGEDNLPGLPLCMSCGQELGAEVEVPASTLPRVQAANPLAAGGPARPRRRVRVVGLDAQSRVFFAVLGACLHGLPPGLGAWRRGERRTAWGLLSAAGASVLLWWALWSSPVQGLAWAPLCSVVATSCWIEARARSTLPGVPGEAVALALSLALAFLIYAAGLTAVDLALPRVGMADQPNLAGGQFLVDPARIEELAVDDLVVVGRLPRWWQLGGGGVQITTVLALPGQVVTRQDGRILVDGEPPLAHPLNPQAPEPGLVGERLVPGPGEVAVYVSPIAVIGQDRLAGRIRTRWLPAPDRGPVAWPPPDPTRSPP